MKIDRMIGILSVLLQKEKTTVAELAEIFEVSRRTISRDIDSICQAGIPICTLQGAGGGIRIMDGYCIDRTLFTSKDMAMILAGLRSLDSVSGSGYYRQLMERLQPGASFISGKESVLIDLSSWDKSSVAPKIQLFQETIEKKQLMSFTYCTSKGEGKRVIEPYYLVFRWYSWYVWGWCTERQDFRLFKLNRMDFPVKTGQAFEGREAPPPDLSAERNTALEIEIKALFSRKQKWRLAEEFGMDCFQEMGDGRLLFSSVYTDMENLVHWLLTFGDEVEVLEPEEVRERIMRVAENMLKQYGKDS